MSEFPGSELLVRGLHASIEGAHGLHEILRGVDLEVRSGEVHAVMGPNGCGKSTLSHVLMGRTDYVVTEGSVRLDGDELLGLPTWQRAAKGLFLAMQYPVEVPGVPVTDLVAVARRARGGSARAAPQECRAAPSQPILRASAHSPPAPRCMGAACRETQQSSSTAQRCARRT